MKRNTFSALLLVLLISISSSSFAQVTQKIGYINTNALMSEMPEVKEAEANLDSLQQSFNATGQAMVDSFQSHYQKMVQQNEAGDLNPKQLANAENSLKEEQQKIKEFENQMQFAILQRREQIFQPIYQKISQVIAEVSAEQGYTHIFDIGSSSNLIYMDPTTDIISFVKIKLGISTE